MISLLDIVKYLNGDRKLQNVGLEIFIARIILDVHLQSEPFKFFLESELVSDKEKHVNEMMNQNHCSVETLMHFWNLWKKKILDLLSYLHLPDRPDKNDLSMYENFCLMYFGVRKEENSIIVLDPEANWLKDNQGGFLERSHNLIKLSFIQFVTYAQHFWNSELSSVGTRVLDRLESLHTFGSKNEFPLLSKGRIVLCIFEVAKFLSESKLLGIKCYSRKNEKFLALSKRSLFDLVFLLDWRRAMTKSMIALRENGSTKQILGEVLDENLSHKCSKLTHGQIGRIVMLLFVAGQLTDQLFQRISTLLDHMPAWTDFIGALKDFINCGYGHVPLVCKFQKALESTFETSWKQEPDYISPHCFMYLIECLVFFASSCLGNQSFYTTKSTLLEMVTYYSYKEYMGACLVVPNVELHNSVARALVYVSDMVQRLLNNKRDIQEWIKKSTNPTWCCSTLVLRLVIVLSLVHLNNGSDMSVVRKLLLRKDIQSDLPVVFQKKFYSAGSSQICDRLHFLRNF
ncbi:uncharacterized protein [Elaeis guineensis]|uniref:uncharacterized protein n=1 Tax=Elaeis guineensis var. tenera TaxID=51953 RepID=UPI003C6D8A54